MQIRIPKKLLKYVHMSKKGLTHSEDMPDELKPLFEKTKKEIEEIKAKYRPKI